MPVTFLAHQAPVLPIVRRWPHAVDGMALVVGSMAPDFAYVLSGSRFSLWAHALPALVLFCVPVTIAVSWVIARVLAPVVPCYLPPGGPFRLPDYRGLATHRFGLVRTPLCALIGALTHVALDHLTHEWGWLAEHAAWYQEPIVEWTILGRQWTPFRVAQYLGHIALSAFTVWWLWRAGSRRWLAARAAQIPVRRSPVGAAALFGGALVGTTVAASWVLGARAGSATDIMRVAAGAFLGLVAGSLVARVATTNPTLQQADATSNR